VSTISPPVEFFLVSGDEEKAIIHPGTVGDDRDIGLQSGKRVEQAVGILAQQSDEGERDLRRDEDGEERNEG
jgi:hypothetical protein